MVRMQPKFRLLPALLLAAVLALAGCQTMHHVKIDAINDPQKAMGSSYRLKLRDPSGSLSDSVAAEAESRIRDALAARGLFEAPAGTAPDMVIDAEYGIGPGQMKIVYQPRDSMGPIYGGPSPGGAKPIMVFEKFIKLSAREATADDVTPPKGRSAHRGEEIWSLHVSVEDPKRDLEPYLEVLASSAVDYIGANTGAEKYVDVEDKEARSNLRTRSTAGQQASGSRP